MPRLLLAAVLGLVLFSAPTVGAGPTAAATTCPSGYVALTFDDGPSAENTPRLVRILKRVHAPATFFMVGQQVAAAPAAARLVGKSGFQVGNHSYRHQNMTTQTRAQIRETADDALGRLRDSMDDLRHKVEEVAASAKEAVGRKAPGAPALQGDVAGATDEGTAPA